MNKQLLKITQDYIAAYPKQPLPNVTAEEQVAYVAEQLQNIVSFFKNHTRVDVFYSTAKNLQVFFTAAEAWNHVSALEDRTILKIHRADVAELLSEGSATEPAPVSKYAKAPIEVLQNICIERGIEHDKDATAQQLIELIEKPEAEYTAVLVTAQMLEDEPALAEKGVEAGQTIYVPKDVQTNFTEGVVHLLMSGNAEQVIEAIKACEDATLVQNTLEAEQAAKKPRKTVVSACKARLKELAG